MPSSTAPKRRQWRGSATKKEILWVHQNGRCALCKRPTILAPDTNPKIRHKIATLDHIHERADGGTDGIWNLRVVCWKCNQKRSNGAR